MTPRVLTVVIRAPAAVSDRELAEATHRTLFKACTAVDPAMVYPDRDTIRVKASTVGADEDAFMRSRVDWSAP